MSTFVIVPGAWDTPATMEPLVDQLESAGHAVIASICRVRTRTRTWNGTRGAMRDVLPDDLTDVVLVGYSFGGFTASRIAVEHPDVPMVTSQPGSRGMAHRCWICSWEATRSRPAKKRGSPPSTG